MASREPTCGYQNCDINQIWIFDGHIKVRESFYTLVIIWINTIPNHTDTSRV